ncbi:JmjC domain-containing histone demethylation protein 1 [Amylostereum chailletii]|nr:JmjC domain-containing histone demethylation protein 1 [Amylostereum chailletii]
MSRPNLRSTRLTSTKSPELESVAPVGPYSPARDQDDKCPACYATGETSSTIAADKESWIRCDACKMWFHWRCVESGEDLAAIDKWFCSSCRSADPSRTVTLKPPARKSTRKKPIRDYANLHAGVGPSGSSKWVELLDRKEFAKDSFKRMGGAEVSQQWLETDPSAMQDPIVVEKPDGLGMKMPSDDTTVARIAEIIGEDTPVEVIDVATQSSLSGWTLGKWSQYYSLEPSARDKIRNVISLEISSSKLAEEVLPPRLVREIDWVEKYWPSNKKGRGHVYPKVQLYCLMGVQGAWTDWHVDFAGSSVYYHILRGAKTFLFIRPTAENLAAYERWSGTEMQTHTWLGYLVDEVIRIDLSQGNTMIIPTGWIHAVHTPVDALVFGGNFLHSYNAQIQLKIRDIEIATHVPKKFRFPLFSKLSWYVGEKFLRDLRAKEEFSTRVLESVEALSCFLVSEARTLERGTEAGKREAKDQVPSDRVKDPSAVARELRWRVRLALGSDSDGESIEPRRSHGTDSDHGGLKRKRGAAGEPEHKFKNFQPVLWDGTVKSEENRTKQVRKSRPVEDDEGWRDAWLGVETEEPSGSEAVVHSKRRMVTRVRRTASGLERQRMESVLERWEWGTDPDERMDETIS